jgi:thiamine biosynthesis protein ThiC
LTRFVLNLGKIILPDHDYIRRLITALMSISLQAFVHDSRELALRLKDLRIFDHRIYACNPAIRAFVVREMQSEDISRTLSQRLRKGMQNASFHFVIICQFDLHCRDLFGNLGRCGG